MSFLVPCLYAVALAVAGLVVGYLVGRKHEQAVLTGLLAPEKWLLR
jgi:hypothetical protein